MDEEFNAAEIMKKFCHGNKKAKLKFVPHGISSTVTITMRESNLKPWKYEFTRFLILFCSLQKKCEGTNNES